MQKFRKLLTLLLAGAMLLGLAACGEKPQENNDVSVTDGQWQNVADVDALDLLVDEINGGYTVQIPQFKNPDNNAALNDMNGRLQQLAEEYEESKWNEATRWEIVPLVLDTPNYLSVVLYQGEWPNYGTDGSATSYVYNKITKSEVTKELAWSMAGGADDKLIKAVEDYCKTLNRDGITFYWSEYVDEAFYIDRDGHAALVLDVLVKPNDKDAIDPWNYLLIYKDGKIIDKLANGISRNKDVYTEEA